ncbi:Transcription initiation factor TFIID subunit A, partial [Rhizoctonia solani]
MASNTNGNEQQQAPATPVNVGGTLYQPTPTAASRPAATTNTVGTTSTANTATPVPAAAASNVQPTLNTIQANLSNLLKTPASATHSAQIAAALAPHMTQIMNLAKQGTLTESQMAQLKTLAGIVAPGNQQPTPAATTPRPLTTAPPRPAGTPQPTAAPATMAQTAAKPAATTPAATYPPATQQSWSRPVPVLSGQLLPQYAATAPAYAPAAPTGPAPVPRRPLKDLVYGFESDVRVDPDAEQFLLQAADDFIESVTQFACRVAKHREKNYDLHIPGFATDETRHAAATAAQASVTNAISKPIAPLPAARKSRHRATDPATLRASRLAAVRDAASRPA